MEFYKKMGYRIESVHDSKTEELNLLVEEINNSTSKLRPEQYKMLLAFIEAKKNYQFVKNLGDGNSDEFILAASVLDLFRFQYQP
ncbi:hypothetical protein P7H65_08250 [Vagococcus fluvialis]|jgi:hypothetical protein|nr:hypothetical protein [Vagococcus fluvialis]